MLQSPVLAVHGSSPREKDETLTLYWKEAGEHLLRAFMYYDPIQKDEKYAVGTNILIARLDSLVRTVIRCLVEKEKCVGKCRKEYVRT